MNKIQNQHIALLLLAAVLIAGGLLYWSTRPDAEKKPVPKVSEPEWYVVFSTKNQTATAYTDPSGSTISSSGKKYFLGSVAVHPRYPVNQGGNPLKPIIPYGTILHLSQPINIHGREYSSVKVIDTGDVNYRLWSQSPYWIDVFFGTSAYWTNRNAQEFGTDAVTYHWVEKWK